MKINQILIKLLFSFDKMAQFFVLGENVNSCNICFSISTQFALKLLLHAQKLKHFLPSEENSGIRAYPKDSYDHCSGRKLDRLQFSQFG